MTSSRVVRGTRGRIIFCICALIVGVAIIAFYSNTLSQLDEVRKTSDQCHQQQENLSTQLQVIFDYKQRLEKSLKTEKAEHQQTKKIFESKIDEDQTKYEKSTNEANLKFSSLQQHFNLLKTQHDDFKEECSKNQQQQSDEINILQAKLKEVQGQLKQSVNEKENSFEHLKTQYMQLQVEKENLEKQIQTGQNKDGQSDSEINHLTKVNHQLQRELDSLKVKCSTSTKAQDLSVGPQNQISPPANASNQNDDDLKIQPADNKQQEPVNVADLPSNVDEEHDVGNQQLMSPKTEKPIVNNEVNVLPIPNVANVLLPNQKTSTTAKSSLSGAQPIHIPTIATSNILNKPSEQGQQVLPIVKKLPVGVVPVPESHLETIDKLKGVVFKPNGEEKDVRDDVNNAFPNRYRTNLIVNEIANEDKAKEADKLQRLKEENKEKSLKADVGDADNAALEEIDPPANNNLDAVDPFALEDNHDSDKINIRSHKVPKHHVNSLADEQLKLGKQGHKIYDGPEGAEYDKAMQVGENDPEAEDDDPDYADPIARQKDIAIRN